MGDLIRDGRAKDASRLLEILQRREAIVAELQKLRASWRWVPASDRRRVELEAATHGDPRALMALADFYLTTDAQPPVKVRLKG